MIGPKIKIDVPTPIISLRNSERRWDVMRHALNIVASVAVLLFTQVTVTRAQYIGKAPPLPIGDEPLLHETASPELYDFEGITGGTLKRALGDRYEDRALLTTRGKHDSEIYKAVSPEVV